VCSEEDFFSSCSVIDVGFLRTLIHQGVCFPSILRFDNEGNYVVLESDTMKIFFCLDLSFRDFFFAVVVFRDGIDFDGN
jgi:hypothetical protein